MSFIKMNIKRGLRKLANWWRLQLCQQLHKNSHCLLMSVFCLHCKSSTHHDPKSSSKRSDSCWWENSHLTLLLWGVNARQWSKCSSAWGMWSILTWCCSPLVPAGTARHNPQSHEAISSTASIPSPTKGPQEIDKCADKWCQAKRMEIYRASTTETK